MWKEIDRGEALQILRNLVLQEKKILDLARVEDSEKLEEIKEDTLDEILREFSEEKLEFISNKQAMQYKFYRDLRTYNKILNNEDCVCEYSETEIRAYTPKEYMEVKKKRFNPLYV